MRSTTRSTISGSSAGSMVPFSSATASSGRSFAAACASRVLPEIVTAVRLSIWVACPRSRVRGTRTTTVSNGWSAHWIAGWDVSLLITSPVRATQLRPCWAELSWPRRTTERSMHSGSPAATARDDRIIVFAAAAIR